MYKIAAYNLLERTLLEEFVRLIIAPGTEVSLARVVEEILPVHQIQTCWIEKTDSKLISLQNS